MDAAEIIGEISRLPLTKQKQVLEKIGANIKQIEMSEEERLEQFVCEELQARGNGRQNHGGDSCFPSLSTIARALFLTLTPR